MHTCMSCQNTHTSLFALLFIVWLYCLQILGIMSRTLHHWTHIRLFLFSSTPYYPEFSFFSPSYHGNHGNWLFRCISREWTRSNMANNRLGSVCWPCNGLEWKKRFLDFLSWKFYSRPLLRSGPRTISENRTPQRCSCIYFWMDCSYKSACSLTTSFLLAPAMDSF